MLGLCLTHTSPVLFSNVPCPVSTSFLVDPLDHLTRIHRIPAVSQPRALKTQIQERKHLAGTRGLGQEDNLEMGSWHQTTASGVRAVKAGPRPDLQINGFCDTGLWTPSCEGSLTFSYCFRILNS